MEIRPATTDDVEAIRSIARSSLEASYDGILDDETIDEFVEGTYGNSLSAAVEREDTLYLVAETDEGTAGFSQSDLIGDEQNTGRIDWIHVDPAFRGEGTGPRLFVRTREALRERGASKIEAQVLSENEAGMEFYKTRGFERAGTVDVEIGTERYEETIFVEVDRGAVGEPTAPESIRVNGQTVYVNYNEGVKGSKAPFYTAHLNESAEDPYGWFCGNCNSLNNAMDAMGRIECNECGNRRKATRWDASYL